MALGLSLDTIFLHGVKEADKGGTGSHGWACGDRGHFEWLLANKEMEISEKERVVVGVVATLRKYSPGLSRKKKAIQARSLIARCRSVLPRQTTSGAWGMETVIGRTQVGEEYCFA